MSISYKYSRIAGLIGWMFIMASITFQAWCADPAVNPDSMNEDCDTNASFAGPLYMGRGHLERCRPHGKRYDNVLVGRRFRIQGRMVAVRRRGSLNHIDDEQFIALLSGVCCGADFVFFPSATVLYGVKRWSIVQFHS